MTEFSQKLRIHTEISLRHTGPSPVVMLHLFLLDVEVYWNKMRWNSAWNTYKGTNVHQSSWSLSLSFCFICFSHSSAEIQLILTDWILKLQPEYFRKVNRKLFKHHPLFKHLLILFVWNCLKWFLSWETHYTISSVKTRNKLDTVGLMVSHLFLFTVQYKETYCCKDHYDSDRSTCNPSTLTEFSEVRTKGR